MKQLALLITIGALFLSAHTASASPLSDCLCAQRHALYDYGVSIGRMTPAQEAMALAAIGCAY